MEIDNNLIKKFTKLTTHVYQHLEFIPIAQDPISRTLRFQISEEQLAVLSEIGYNQWFFELGKALFEIPTISDLWSEKGIEELLINLVHTIASLKIKVDNELDEIPDLTELTKNWLVNININFEERECYLLISGLVLDKPVVIGPVTFWPLEDKLKELNNIPKSLLNIYFGSSKHHSTIASAAISAENNKAAQLLREVVEESLNIIRYLGTLIWWNYSPRHIYTSGREINRTSYVLSLGKEGESSIIGESTYSVYPIELDENTLKLAHFYGLEYLTSILSSQDITPIEKSLLTAIHWYSDGIQDLSPTYAFMKYIVAIEALIKLHDEKAANKLPKRLAYLLSQGLPTKLKKHKKEFRMLFEERNSVFHSGIPKEHKIEFLAWQSSLIARNAIQNLIILIESHKLKTKQDFVNWVNTAEQDFINMMK